MTDGWYARFMFRLFDYTTWQIFHRGTEYMLVTINTTDRTVTTSLIVGDVVIDGLPRHGTYREWYDWLNAHPEVEDASSL